MSVAVEGGSLSLPYREGGVLSCIDNVPTSPRSHVKKQRLITDCRSPATPVQPRTACAVNDPLAEALAAARELLRDPSVSDAAPVGREDQHARMVDVVEAFAATGRGQALYVSGLPGTGKSHTVKRVLQALDHEGDITTLWINCMAITGAGEVYSRIHAAACCDAPTHGAATLGKRRAPDSGRTAGSDSSGGIPGSASGSYAELLAALSGSAASSGGAGGKRRRSSVGARVVTGGRRVAIVLDEVDALVSKGQQAVYDLFMLPHQPGVRALVIGIANSIDLTERALPALKLRGCTPTLVPFPAYTTAQVMAILRSCLEQVSERVIDDKALELCARQVASTSGDLRLAIKACRAALDALATSRAERFAAAAAAAAAVDVEGGGAKDQQQRVGGEREAPACVAVRDMMAALGRLAGVRSSQHGAATVTTVRSLPNQQQLLLYSLSILCSDPELPEPPTVANAAAGAPAKQGACRGADSFSTPPASAKAGGGRSAASLWAEVTPGPASGARAVHVRTPGAGASVGRRLFGAGGGKGGANGEGCVLAVGLHDAYVQYCKVCRLVGMGTATRAELRHMADLLAQMALLDVLQCAAAGGGGKGAAAAAATPGGGRRGKGPRGFGDVGAAGGAAEGGGGEGVQLALRVGRDEVQRALAANPALRCLVDDA